MDNVDKSCLCQGSAQLSTGYVNFYRSFQKDICISHGIQSVHLRWMSENLSPGCGKPAQTVHNDGIKPGPCTENPGFSVNNPVEPVENPVRKQGGGGFRAALRPKNYSTEKESGLWKLLIGLSGLYLFPSQLCQLGYRHKLIALLLHTVNDLQGRCHRAV